MSTIDNTSKWLYFCCKQINTKIYIWIKGYQVFVSSTYSDLNSERNKVILTIFNYGKCEAISSQDFRIKNIKLTARAAIGSAEYHGDMHYIVDNEPKFLDIEKHAFAKSK